MLMDNFLLNLNVTVEHQWSHKKVNVLLSLLSDFKCWPTTTPHEQTRCSCDPKKWLALCMYRSYIYSINMYYADGQINNHTEKHIIVGWFDLWVSFGLILLFFLKWTFSSGWVEVFTWAWTPPQSGCKIEKKESK